MIIDQFSNTDLPMPTKENPFIQVDWIFEQKASTYDFLSTRQSYASSCVFYKKYLAQTLNYNHPPNSEFLFFIEKEWDNLALVKVKRWIEATNIEGTEDYLTSGTIAGHFSAIRRAMIYAYECGYIESLITPASVNRVVRETSTRAAFTSEEYDAIFKVITPLVKFSKGLLLPYKKIGFGKDPRIRLPAREKIIGQGWACWKLSDDGKEMVPSDNNMIWYFENILNCQPIPSIRRKYEEHKSFLDSAWRFFGGINTLYRKWGVSTFTDQFVLMPLIVKLVAETGLNVESVLSLRRDCFSQEHDLTHLPCIEYYKQRSKGEKVLVLELFDGKSEKEYLKLGQKQSQIIASTIRTILELTQPLVELADEEDKEYLLLYQRSQATSFGKVTRMKKWVMRNWMRNIAEEYDLRDSEGKRLEFNLTRFRPTKFTELVQQGYDIFNIMGIAGHSSIITTLSYVDKLKCAEDFHLTISRELENIKKNAYEYQKIPLPVAADIQAKPGNFIFKSNNFSFCKNPYDPPSKVKRSKNYYQGDPCIYFNMCLQCKNVLITEMNLPKLAAYRNEISRTLKNGVEDMPRQGELYKKNLAILDEIFTPDKVFPEAILNRAIQVANDVEFEVLDSFIY